MGGFIVPRTVFSPIVGGDFLPRVVENMCGGKDLHFGVMNEERMDESAGGRTVA